MADKAAKRELTEIFVHLLRHAYFMPKGFEDIQILSQGIVLSDFSGLPVEINPFSKALFCGIDFNYSIDTFHSLIILLSSKRNLHLKQHKTLDKRHNSFVLLTLDFLQSNRVFRFSGIFLNSAISLRYVHVEKNISVILC